MPLYEYECKKCHEVTEALQKFSEAPLKKCPRCGGKVSKIMSRNAFHLRGQGWYVTDYKGKNSSTAASASASESGGGEAKADKPEKKKETKKPKAGAAE
ncbi:MAG: zinc ribbon domain-containing protein [Desulfarculus sp.]|jgi:putative FmdB family regulatory protein|nr:MAG: zinc ribbon domain-containing protein [Desulfarculus sp.]